MTGTPAGLYERATLTLFPIPKQPNSQKRFPSLPGLKVPLIIIM